MRALFETTGVRRAAACALLATALVAGCAQRSGSGATADPPVADSGVEPNELTPSERAAGWILLFDGRTLDGWRRGSEVDWTAEGGVIRATEGEVGLLYTEEDFGDLELKVDFRAAPGTNSGVFLRSPPDCRDPAEECYEINVAPPEHPFPTGSLVARARAEGIAEGQGWRSLHLRAEGGRLTVRLDGEELVDYLDPEPLPAGPVGLQYNQGRIEFRGVKARRLGDDDG